MEGIGQGSRVFDVETWLGCFVHCVAYPDHTSNTM
jgi:hypothetical protein